MARGQQFQITIILARGIAGHNVGLLFTVGKTCHLKTLLYCSQLDCIDIGSNVHRQRQCMRKDCPMGC